MDDALAAVGTTQEFCRVQSHRVDITGRLLARQALKLTHYPLIVAGVGASATIPVIQSALIGAVAPSAVGKASGANNMLQELGGAFGVAIFVAVFTTAGGYVSAEAFSDGFAPAIGVCAALALAGAIVGMGLPKRRQPDQGEEWTRAPLHSLASLLHDF